MADDEIAPRAGEAVTANYGWIKPTVGDSDDAWGGYINSDLDGIDSTVHGIQTSVPAASSTTPAMDGTAAVGTGTTWARADHVHPVDTSRYAATNPSGYQTAAQVSSAITAAAYTLPTASTSVLGGVKVDGTTVTIASGVISAAGGGGGISDAPNDGTSYARKSAAWAHLTHSDLTDWATATATFTYTLPNATTTVLGGVKVDGTTITAASGVISAVQPTVPGPSGTTPVMDGTATAGSSALYSRGDHVHPTDTTRAAVSALPVVATTVPLIDGTATIGASGKWADGAHVHPTDTSRAPVAGVTNGSAASAGQVGEILTATASAVAAGATTVAKTAVTLNLTAGDWDIWGVGITALGAGGATTLVTSLSTTNNALDAVWRNQLVGPNLGASSNQFQPVLYAPLSVSAATPIYLVTTITYASGSCTIGGTIYARRRR